MYICGKPKGSEADVCLWHTNRTWCDVALSPLSGVKRKSDLRAIRLAFDPHRKWIVEVLGMPWRWDANVCRN